MDRVFHLWPSFLLHGRAVGAYGCERAFKNYRAHTNVYTSIIVPVIYYGGTNHPKFKTMIYYFAQYPGLAGICWVVPGDFGSLMQLHAVGNWAVDRRSKMSAFTCPPGVWLLAGVPLCPSTWLPILQDLSLHVVSLTGCRPAQTSLRGILAEVFLSYSAMLLHSSGPLQGQLTFSVQLLTEESKLTLGKHTQTGRDCGSHLWKILWQLLGKAW